MKYQIPLLLLSSAILSACGGSKNANLAPAQTEPRAREASIENLERRILRIPDHSVTVTELSYCERPSPDDRCYSRILLKLESSRKVEFVLMRPEHSEALNLARLSDGSLFGRVEREVITRDLEERLSFDLEKIQYVLDMEAYFSLYRCRKTSEHKRLLSLGAPYRGSYLIEAGGFFKSMELGVAPVFEIDRRSKTLLNVALLKLGPSATELTNGPLTHSLVVSAVFDQNKLLFGTINHPPERTNTGLFLVKCDLVYEAQLYGARKPDLSSDPIERDRERFLPLATDELEANAEFAREAEIRTRRSNEAKPRWEAFWIRETFFSLVRYPAYPYDSDPLWLQIRKLNEENQK